MPVELLNKIELSKDNLQGFEFERLMDVDIGRSEYENSSFARKGQDTLESFWKFSSKQGFPKKHFLNIIKYSLNKNYIRYLLFRA